MTKSEIIEGLCPELANCVVECDTFGYQLRHPLVLDLFLHPERNSHLNKCLEVRKQYAQKCWNKGDYGQYVFAHERPFRFTIYFAQVHGMIDEQADAKLLLDVWTDCEHPNVNREHWDSCFDKLSHVPVLKDSLAELTFPLTLYRGFSCGEGDDFTDQANGLSWTTDKATAVKFAHRYAENSDMNVLGVITVTSSDELYAYDNSRGESEVIVKVVFPYCDR